MTSGILRIQIGDDQDLEIMIHKQPSVVDPILHFHSTAMLTYEFLDVGSDVLSDCNNCDRLDSGLPFHLTA